MKTNIIRLGTRSSPLALAQADLVKEALLSTNSSLSIHIVPFTTKGDMIKGSLKDIGGKGLFTTELQQALKEGKIDGAVHSLKDIEFNATHDLTLAAFLKREAPQDVFITRKPLEVKFDPLQPVDLSTFTFGTSSPRRSRQIETAFPLVSIKEFRGNVGSRLQKLQAGDVEATILAMAGLKRLGYCSIDALSHAFPLLNFSILPTHAFIPAAGQGVVVVESCPSQSHLFRGISHTETEIISNFEISFIKKIGGNCNTAVGCYIEYISNVEESGYLLKGFYEGRSIELYLGQHLEELETQNKNIQQLIEYTAVQILEQYKRSEI